MSFSIVCQHCKGYIEIQDKFAQPFIKCPSCQKMSKVTYPAKGSTTSTTAPKTPPPPPPPSAGKASAPPPPPPSSGKPASPPGMGVRKPSPETVQPSGEEAPVPAGGGGLLDHTTFLVKERVGLTKIKDTFDIFDPNSQKQIGIAKEETSNWFIVLRLLVAKQFLPQVVNIYEDENRSPVISLKKGIGLFRKRVDVLNAQGTMIGYFVSKLFSLGGGFYLYDPTDNQIGEVAGDWKGWNFTFKTVDGKELGSVSKQWAGFAKELFTSADNYVIGFKNLSKSQKSLAAMLLAAGIAIDIIYKEH